ncbi:MAG: hypothetical protein J0I18_00720, partial [Actinobacteria bacterium]|nr:hypothetical protein [Actinomycetota bacterium]
DSGESLGKHCGNTQSADISPARVMEFTGSSTARTPGADFKPATRDPPHTHREDALPVIDTTPHPM